GGIAGPPVDVDRHARAGAAVLDRIDEGGPDLGLVGPIGVPRVSATGQRFPGVRWIEPLEESARPDGAGAEGGDSGGIAFVTGKVAVRHDAAPDVRVEPASRRCRASAI